MPNLKIRKAWIATIFMLATGVVCGQFAKEIASPEGIKLDRERGLSMLSEIKDVVREKYYDKEFHGIDLDARFKAAADRIKTQTANWQIFRTIAQVLFEFDDSHTVFVPPSRSTSLEYGFTMQAIGENCYVTRVKKGSDAEKKGLSAGDRLLKIDGNSVSRQNLWLARYIYYSLDPQSPLKLNVEGLDGKIRELDVEAKLITLEERQKQKDKKKKEKRENPYKCQPLGADVTACRLDTFSVETKSIDKMMTEAQKAKKLILDLRGNGGGYVKIEEYLTGHFFDRDVKIADFVMRGKKKERIAKPRTERGFAGELIVLIDSDSASASEVFARIIQLEKRGRIIGDVSAGAVMTSNFFTLVNQRGVSTTQTYSFFGLNITVADLIMSDGNRLEKIGVKPDKMIGPSPYALANRSDPILSYAAGLFGATLAPEDAGKLNFIVEKDEDEDKETDGEDN